MQDSTQILLQTLHQTQELNCDFEHKVRQAGLKNDQPRTSYWFQHRMENPNELRDFNFWLYHRPSTCH